MKNYFKFSVFISLLVLFLFAACNRISLDITKRKYRSGFYVDGSIDKRNVPAKKNTLSQPNEERMAQPGADTNAGTAVKESESGSVEINSFNTGHETNNLRTVSGEMKQPGKKFVSRSQERQNPSYPEPAKLDSTEQLSRTSAVNGDNQFYLWSGLAALLCGGLFYASRRKARKISRWAKENPGKTRTIIAASQFVTAMGGLIAGNMLWNQGVEISETARNVLAATFLSSMVCYPVSNSRLTFFKKLYLRQKLNDLMIGISGLAVIVAIGNQLPSQRTTATHSWIHAESLLRPFTEKTSAYIEHHLQFKRQQSILTDHPSSWIAKTLIILVIVVLALGLLTLVAALACGLACSDNTAAAILVGFAGLALIAIFSFKAIRAVLKT